MGWKRYQVVHQRLQLIDAYIKNEASMTALCKHFCISRKTGYKWLNLYLNYGEKALEDSSKTPNDPYRLYTKEQIEIAIEYKLKHRTFGPRKVLVKLSEKYP